MKILKKLAAVALSASLVCSAGALAACGNNEETLTPVTAEEYQKLATALGSSSVDGFSLSGNVSMNSSFSGYSYKVDSDLSGVFDVSSGNGDVSVKMTQSAGGLKMSAYTYLFVRDWNAFSSDDFYNSPVTDFSEETLQYLGSANEAFAYVDLPVTDLAGYATCAANYLLTAFANAAGALYLIDGEYVVDLNEAYYNYANDMMSVVNSLTDSTTIGDILNNRVIRKYAMIITELIPAELLSAGLEGLVDLSELYPVLPEEALAPLGDMAEMVQMLWSVISEYDLSGVASVKPDANSTTYDYIVKILGSDEFSALAGEIISDMVSGQPDVEITAPSNSSRSYEVTVKVTDITVGLMLQAMGYNLNLSQFKAYFAQSISDIKKDSVVVVISSYDSNQGVLGTNVESAELSGMKLTYKISGNNLVKMGVAATVIQYANYVKSSEISVSLSLDFSVSQINLTDIDNVAVEYTEYAWDETKTYPSWIYVTENDYLAFEASLVLNNGELTGFIIADEHSDDTYVLSNDGGVFEVNGVENYYYVDFFDNQCRLFIENEYDYASCYFQANTVYLTTTVGEIVNG